MASFCRSLRTSFSKASSCSSNVLPLLSSDTVELTSVESRVRKVVEWLVPFRYDWPSLWPVTLDNEHCTHKSMLNDEYDGVFFHIHLVYDDTYCGWLYFCGYQFSWIELKWHIHGVPNSWQYFPSQFIQKIAFSWVLEFMDRAIHKNHEN